MRALSLLQIAKLSVKEPRESQESVALLDALTAASLSTLKLSLCDDSLFSLKFPALGSCYLYGPGIRLSKLSSFCAPKLGELTLSNVQFELIGIPDLLVALRQ